MPELQYAIKWIAKTNKEDYFLGTHSENPSELYKYAKRYKPHFVKGNNTKWTFQIVRVDSSDNILSVVTKEPININTAAVIAANIAQEKKPMQATYNPYASSITRRTQKARGIEALRAAHFNVPSFSVIGLDELKAEINTNQLELFSDNFRISDNSTKLGQLIGKFVRPCPMVPRHGFVDSRPINSIPEAKAIIYETAKVEDKAEFIAMPFINAKYSAVYVPGNLTIGTSNDGATAGHSSRAIAMLGSLVTPEAMVAAGITEAPYTELVWEDYGLDTPYFVQLRNGPIPPNGINFVPQEMTVKQVILARAVQIEKDGIKTAIIQDKDGKEIDFVAWESLVKTFPKGTVVYHPNGSLTSHTAVHCVLNNVPCVTSFEPKIGQVLKQESETRELDISKMRAGFYYGATNRHINYRESAHMMLLGCHSTSAWLGRHDYLLGVSMGCTYRLLITAGLGEMRHHPMRKRRPERQAVYEKVWNKILTLGTRTRYVKMLESFKSDKRWKGSVGGVAWYNATRYAGEIYNALLDSNGKHALELLNEAIHTEHNTGWTFNKFAKAGEMSVCAANPVQTAVKLPHALYNGTLESEKDLSEALDFWKGKKHFDSDLIDEKEAKADIEEEESDCEDSDIYSMCGNSTSPNENGQCDNTNCKTCYPVVEESKPWTIEKVALAQVKIKEGHLHVQYKLESQKESDVFYKSCDIPFSKTGLSLENWQTAIDSGIQVPSFAGAKDGKSVSYYASLKPYPCDCASCKGAFKLGGYSLRLDWSL